MQETPPLLLRDIHLPDPISWWPPAPGWWILAAIVILIYLSIAAFRSIKRRRSVRVAALKTLDKISVEFNTNRDTLRLVKSLSILMRRICLSYFPRQKIAALTGDKWLLFLDECLDWGQVNDRFSLGAGRALIAAPYQKNAQIDGEKLLSLCSHWIKALPLLKAGGK